LFTADQMAKLNVKIRILCRDELEEA